MNEFLEQFLLESREHVEQATAELLALEKSPADKARLDGVLRAFHTLKGGAGIVDFTAMAHAIHAAEGVLVGARSGNRAITSQFVSECLGCVDQIVQWLDTIAATGALPKGADVQARALTARFGGAGSAAPTPTRPGAVSAPDDWAQALLARHRDEARDGCTAIRYAPDADCFFAGVDPVARMAALPDLLALDISPALPWPALEELDPFACNVVLTALTRLAMADVAAALGDIVDQCDLRQLTPAPGIQHRRQLSDAARGLLETQLAVIGNDGDIVPGRLAAAGIAAANVLRHAGRRADADRVAQQLEESLAQKAPGLLRAAIHSALHAMQPAPAAIVPASPQSAATTTMRIDAARVDALVNLTGELTVAKNAIGHTAKLAQEADNALAAMLRERHALLDRLVTELQQTVLALRVRPLRTVFQRFPRLMREISAEIGKPAELVLEGGDTEADKAIVEMLFEPLLHVLRNAVGHGVEDAASRAALGKPAIASISLRAMREQEHIVVEVSDDGGGVDIERVREVALSRGLVTAEELAAMGERDVIHLLFAPGFSTARQVTDLSGRGVGLDSVRTAVEGVGGRVDITSRPRAGTTVRLTLPFSVMMTRVMLVAAGEQTFGIALDAVVETLRVAVDRIVGVGAAQAIVVRDQTVPLIELREALDLPPAAHRQTDATIVLARVNGSLGALRVDRIGERMEVMLKPLEGLLAGTRGIAGSTMLGDGSVLLLLDLGELFR